MFDFVKERDMNYAKDLSLENKKTFLKALLQLAKADGKVDDGEHEFILELARLFGLSSDDAAEIKKKREERNNRSGQGWRRLIHQWRFCDVSRANLSNRHSY